MNKRKIDIIHTCKHRRYEFDEVQGWATCLLNNKECKCTSPPKTIGDAIMQGCINGFEPGTLYNIKVDFGDHSYCGDCNKCNTEEDDGIEITREKKSEPTMEVITHHNEENNWLLVESRLFVGEVMLNAYLEVLDLNDLSNKIPYIDDVWVYKWNEISSSIVKK